MSGEEELVEASGLDGREQKSGIRNHGAKVTKKPDGRRTKVTKRQLKVIEARAQGKTLKESGEAAGYSPKNAAQSAYQALAGLRGRMTALLDEAGLGEKVGIENYLKPALDARQTIYAQKDGKFKDKRTLVAWHPRLRALDMLFKLHGSHPPLDPKEAAQYGVRVIRVDIRRPLNKYNRCATNSWVLSWSWPSGSPRIPPIGRSFGNSAAR